jgi:hypothetical protein
MSDTKYGSIDFDALLSEIEGQPKVEVPIASLIILVGTRSEVGHTKYTITLPENVSLEDDEIITRCDNGEFDLRVPVNKRCHFGGRVNCVGNVTYEVVVYID